MDFRDRIKINEKDLLEAFKPPALQKEQTCMLGVI
jgi:hypothetical protein